MTELVLQTPEGLALRHELAGAGSRSAAALVDLALFVAFALGVFALLGALPGGGVLALWFAQGLLLLAMLYQVLCSFVFAGGTPGKRLLGLRVVDETGFPASRVQHLLRGIFWPLECFLLVPVPLGVLLMAGTRRHQRLGDQVAGTLVLRELPAHPPAEPHADVRWDALGVRRLSLVPAHAARFGRGDQALLRELLGRGGVDPLRRTRMLRRAAGLYLPRVDAETPRDLREARAMLSELYVFLRHMRERASA